MEFAAAALTSIGSAIGGTAAVGAPLDLAAIAAGGTAAPIAAGGSLLSALGSTSTWASILGGAASVASVLNTQRAGDVTAASYELAAGDATANVALETNAGIDRRNSLKAALVQALGERDVAAAASGVDLSFGTPAVARKQAISDAEAALTTDQQTEDLRKSRLLERAASYRMMASYARAGALGKSAALALEGGANLLRRG